MRNEQLPEHKELFEELKRAKAKRIEAQNAMFAAPRGPNQMGVLSTKEYQKASEHEREIGGKLAMLREDARTRLGEMIQAQVQGARIDRKEAERLDALASEIKADLEAV